MDIFGTTEPTSPNQAPEGLGVRHVQVALLFLMSFSLSALSLAMSVSIVAMTTVGISDNPDVPTFPHWKNQSIILSSFYWGFASTQFLGATSSRKYGYKWIMVGATLLASGIGILIPAVAINFGSYWLMLCLVIEGMCQGLIDPLTADFISHWVPAAERTSLGTFVYSGKSLGTVVVTATAGTLSVSWWGWPSIYYTFGAVGICWAGLMTVFGINSPQDHPWISDAEMKYIQYGQPMNKEERIPWHQILRSSPVWALWLSEIGIMWTTILVTTEFPTYLSKCLGFDIATGGRILAVIYFTQWLCIFPMGFSTEYLVSRKIISVSSARKCSSSIASWGPAIFFILLTVSPANKYEALFFVAMILICLSSTYSGFMINYIDLSPNYSGIIDGVGGFAATLASVTAHATVQLIVRNQMDEKQWDQVFWIAAIFTSLINAFYIINGSGDLQKWNISDCSSDETTSLVKNCRRLSVAVE